ncbi:protein of unknown function [Streptomyces sp. KY70]|nr:protein of unknown function [Streptomyces sp. KY70]
MGTRYVSSTLCRFRVMRPVVLPHTGHIRPTGRRADTPAASHPIPLRNVTIGRIGGRMHRAGGRIQQNRTETIRSGQSGTAQTGRSVEPWPDVSWNARRATLYASPRFPAWIGPLDGFTTRCPVRPHLFTTTFTAGASGERNLRRAPDPGRHIPGRRGPTGHGAS